MFSFKKTRFKRSQNWSFILIFQYRLYYQLSKTYRADNAPYPAPKPDPNPPR